MKICFKCHRSLPLSEFYRHQMMGDGHLGKCKECTKKDVRDNYRARHEEKCEYDRRRYKTPERQASIKESIRRRRINHPRKYKAHMDVGRAVRRGELQKVPCEECGSTFRVQAHHDDYRKPLSVRWLCFLCHREKAHGQQVSEFIKKQASK